MTTISPAKRALIAVLVSHPKAETYVQRAFAHDNLEQLQSDLAESGRGLTAKDVMTARDDDGTLMVLSVGLWKNFDKMVELLRKNGECFQVSDFVEVIASYNQTLLKIAEQQNNLAAIFNKNVWSGRPDALEAVETLWFQVSVSERYKFFPEGIVPFKRALLAEKGETPREDQLAKAGVNYKDIPRLFKTDGLFETICAKLKAAGDTLKKKDLLTRDDGGDTLFYAQETWDNFEKLTKYLARNGEYLGVEEYTYRPGKNLSPLAFASERGAIHKIFEPRLWVGRVDEMLKLWDCTADAWKKQVDSYKNFDESVLEAENMTYEAENAIHPEKSIMRGEVSREILTAPVNPESATPVLPLGLKSVWENFGAIEEKLAARGEICTMDDLRLTTGAQKNTCLMVAARFGHFDKVVKVSKAGDKSMALCYDDFIVTTKPPQGSDRTGTSLLRILADRRELPLAFDPKLWVGRLREMEDLWRAVPLDAKSQVDFTDVYTKAVRLTAHDGAKPFSFKTGKPKA